MPELPDLEVFSKNLLKELKGLPVVKVTIAAKAKAAGPRTRFRAIKGQELRDVYRDGKELRLVFTSDIIGLHMMLHGELYWQEGKPKKYTLFSVAFGEGKTLALADFQGQARISLNPEEKSAPDALDRSVTIAFWKKALQTKATIKNVLLAQDTVRGIGNAYADEILWTARISPFSISSAIPPDAIRRLAASVRKVLKDAIKKINKIAPGKIGGEERSFLVIHNAKRTESPKGARIRQATAGGRKTYYTDEQEQYK